MARFLKASAPCALLVLLHVPAALAQEPGQQPATAWHPALLGTLQPPVSVGSGFGQALAAVGDVDGDGHDDFAVGDAGHISGSTTGGVHVFSGKDGSLLRTLVDARAASGFGWRLSTAGDVDGDGLPELAVHGSEVVTSTLSIVSPKSGRVFHTLRSGEEYDFFGHTSAAAGDLDGDGVADVVTGAHTARDRPVLFFFEVKPAAFARACSGRTGKPLWTVEGDDEEAFRFGDVVAAAGDVDGDGVPDVAVGETPGMYAVGWASPSGRVHILSGRDGDPIRRIDSTLVTDPFASALVALGDADGDGGPDLAIGSDQYPASPSGALEGYVRAVSLRDGRTLWTVPGRALQDEFGSALAAIGDWNGDGACDVAVGAPHPSTPPEGPSPGYVCILSGRDGTTLATIESPPDGREFGTTVAAAGDIDGDGHADLLVGAAASGGRGRVHIFSGAKLAAGFPAPSPPAGK